MRRLVARLATEEARDAVLPAVVFVVGLHLLALVVAAATRGSSPGVFDPLAAWFHWDADQYLGLAANGYSATVSPERIVFFPLYPTIIRLGSLAADPRLVALATSAVGTVVGVVGLYRLVRLDAPRAVGRWAVILLLAYPFSSSLVAPYTEGIFLAAVTWSLYLARRATPGSAGWAGVAGFVAALTRMQGVLLVPSLVLEALRTHVGRARALALAAALLPLLAFTAYLAINAAVFGDPLAFLRMERAFWYHENAPPWVVLGGLVEGIVRGVGEPDWLTVRLAPLLAFGLLVAASAWSVVARRSRPAYAAYTILTTLSLMTLTWPISVPRYVVGVVPVFVMLGGLARWPPLAASVAIVSGTCMVALAAVFVWGGWAF